MLNGFDAWRLITRYIEHGKAIRLETLRREVKMLHPKPIPTLEKVEEGVAEFENTIDEYIKAGGTPFNDTELKSDLLAVLPAEIRDALLWKATDSGPFEGFRNLVMAQTAKILMNRRKMTPSMLLAATSGQRDPQLRQLQLHGGRHRGAEPVERARWATTTGESRCATWTRTCSRTTRSQAPMPQLRRRTRSHTVAQAPRACR